MRLEGRVAFLNAADDLVGMAIARALAVEGCDVACNHISPQTAGRVAAGVVELGRRSIVTQALLTDRAQVREAIDRTASELGRLDVLVNNATWFGPTDFPEAEDRDWERWVERNLKAPMYCSQAGLPHMLKAGYGKIINMASVAGTNGLPGYSYYSAGKAGVIGFTKALAAEYAAQGIRVNAVAPAAMRTFNYSPDQEAGIAERIPLRRVGSAEELAALVVYLASWESDHTTGEVFNINGGMAI